MNPHYYALNDYLQETFGEKLYKLALNGGMTCPNRDGRCGDRGCIFCSAGGSGEFAPPASLPMREQIERARALLSHKTQARRFIAYFQSFSNTYAPVERLQSLYRAAMQPPEIAALSIATRPDCLGEDVLALLAACNREKPVWVELGLQTIHAHTAAYIRRGYPLETFDSAVRRLRGIGVHVVVHVILGLPGETRADMEATVQHVAASGVHGIKLHLLHVLEGTDLAADYRRGLFQVLERNAYIDLVTDLLELLPPDMVVHRLTGDGPKRLLLAPLWSADKKAVLAELNRTLRRKNTVQGSRCSISSVHTQVLPSQSL